MTVSRLHARESASDSTGAEVEPASIPTTLNRSHGRPDDAWPLRSSAAQLLKSLIHQGRGNTANVARALGISEGLLSKYQNPDDGDKGGGLVLWRLFLLPSSVRRGIAEALLRSADEADARAHVSRSLNDHTLSAVEAAGEIAHKLKAMDADGKREPHELSECRAAWRSMGDVAAGAIRDIDVEMLRVRAAP